MPLDRRSLLKLTAAAVLPAAPAFAAGAQGRYGAAVKAVEAYARRHLVEFGLPGMTIALADEDGWSTTLQVGFADIDRRIPLGPQHQFEIGSISKSFCAISILRLVEQGKFSLDTPVADLLPGIPLPENSGIAVRHLLAHSSGLPDDAPMFPRGGDGRLWQGFRPGSHFSYSNLGYGLLGEIVERSTGKSHAEALNQTFAALGMSGAHPLIRSTDRAGLAIGYEPLQKDRPVPWPVTALCQAPFTDFAEAAGSVTARPADMARYIGWLIQAGRGRGGPVFSDASAKAFTTPVIKAPDFGPEAQYAFGLAVVPVAGRPCLHHTGGMVAFSSSIHVDAPAGVGGFASTNVNIQGYRPRLVTNFACQALRAVREGKPLPAAPAIDLGDRFDKAGDYAGRFESVSGEAFEIAAKDGGLVLRFSGRESRMQRKAEGVFIVRDPRFSLFMMAFERDAAGKVIRAWHGDDLFAPDAAHRTPPPVPERLKPLLGRYDNDNPWQGDFRVTARGDTLLIEGAALALTPGGWWQDADDPNTCERFRFDGFLNGHATRLNISGTDFVRTPDGPLPV